MTVIVLVAEGKRPRERMQRSGDKMRKDAREKIKKQERERERESEKNRMRYKINGMIRRPISFRGIYFVLVTLNTRSIS